MDDGVYYADRCARSWTVSYLASSGALFTLLPEVSIGIRHSATLLARLWSLYRASTVRDDRGFDGADIRLETLRIFDAWCESRCSTSILVSGKDAFYRSPARAERTSWGRWARTFGQAAVVD